MEEIGGYVKMGTKGEFVVPKPLRIDLNIKPGNILKIMEIDNMMIVKKVDTRITDKEVLLVREINKALKSKGKTYTEKEYLQLLDKRIKKNESGRKA